MYLCLGETEKHLGFFDFAPFSFSADGSIKVNMELTQFPVKHLFYRRVTVNVFDVEIVSRTMDLVTSCSVRTRSFLSHHLCYRTSGSSLFDFNCISITCNSTAGEQLHFWTTQAHFTVK